MGTYIRVSIDNEEDVDRANDIVDMFWCEKDVEIEKAKEHGTPNFLPIGTTIFKVSGGTTDDEISDFIDSVLEVKKAGIKLNFDGSDDVRDYMSDKSHGERLFGEKEWKEYEKKMEEEHAKYEKSVKIYERYREFNNTPCDKTHLCADTIGTGKVGFVYANVEVPTLANVQVPDNAEPPMRLEIAEMTSDKHKIILVPLMRLGTNLPFGSLHNEYDIYELYEKVSSLGVRVCIQRFAFMLYKIIPNVTKDMALHGGVTLDEVRIDAKALMGGLSLRNLFDKTTKDIQSIRRARSIKAMKTNIGAYAQFLIYATGNRGAVVDAFTNFRLVR